MVIELSGVQFGLKSYAWFQNRTRAQRELDLKAQVWFQTKIARREVQLPLYYSHFEDAEFCQDHYLFDLAAGLLKSGNKKAFNLILYLKQKWCNIERKWHDWKQKWCNLKHNWRDLEQTWLRTENCAWFVNKSHCWEPIRLQGSQVISKWI